MGCRHAEGEGNCGPQSPKGRQGNLSPHALLGRLGPGEVAPCGSSWAAALAEHSTVEGRDCPVLCSKDNCQWYLHQGCQLCYKFQDPRQEESQPQEHRRGGSKQDRLWGPNGVMELQTGSSYSTCGSWLSRLWPLRLWKPSRSPGFSND